MFPALPIGIQSQSGAQPKSSTISKAAVFCPCIRYGLTELTSSIGCYEDKSLTISRALSKFPLIDIISAPYINACASFPCATNPSGIKT